ncbi:MAG: tRNA (guanosine(37)-N1)-methyltransferase TrmD [bacterium]
MDIAVLTIFPRMLDAVAEHGIVAQALGKGALTLRRWNPRDFTEDAHRAVDDRPYGGGPGMLMKPAPLAKAIDAAKLENRGPVVYLSPQGERLDQALLAEFAELPALILLAGRYEGIDERIVDSRVAREVSVGDYVLAGGELAAMVLIEGIARLLPGVLGNDLSARQDSFACAPLRLLDCPQYTRPEVFEGRAAPAVLRGGDHEAIRRWRLAQALGRTRARRPDLLAGRELTHEQNELLNAYQSEQNDDESY